MKLRALFEVILVLLLADILTTALSIFFFARLDQVVHVDLYRYGLQFNYEWAERYWTYSRFITGFLLTSVAVIGLLFVFLIVQKGTREIARKRFVSCLLLLIGIAATGFSAYFFSKLDYVVNNDLYNYGLQFSSEWATQYWTYARLMLTLLGLAAAASGVSIMLIIIETRRSETLLSLRAQTISRLDPAKLIPPILFTAGVLALALSIHSTSTILAFIGLGLVFWGAILYYIRPEKYVKETLLASTILPSLADLNQIITELGYKGKAVYLPPRYLKDLEPSKVYISAEKNKKLPLPEEIQKEDSRVFLKNPDAMVITPPGMELTRLFEKKLGTNFTKVDVHYLEQNIPKLLTENLEIAQNVQVKIENSRVCIEIEDSIYQNVCREAKKLSNICGNLGCPLSSAIACALAKATGNAIIIESEQQSQDGKVTKIQYNILKRYRDIENIEHIEDIEDIEV